MNVCAIVSVLTIAIFGQIANCWDQGLRDYILDIHNEMRRRTRGCEVHKLEYDSSLEQQAERWAKRCSYGHELKQGRGENLAFNTNKFDDRKTIDIATDSWYDEIKDYYYGQRSCSRSCHYTQLVWGKTQKVGCYMHKCGYLHGTGYHANDANYLVCFYTPMGNWNGEKPYKTGCPSTCANGQTEDNGLCVGTAAGGGAECTDSTSSCVGWASRGECSRNPKYMNSKCAKSCKQCTAAGTAGECKDSNLKCAGWASRGQCSRNPNYMNSKCAKSCKQC